MCIRDRCYHRLLRLDGKRFAARIVENRGTYNAMQKTPGDLPVAICIGVSLGVHLAASMSPPPGVDELAVAQALSPTPLVKCLTNDLYVPAEAEIVLEGRITQQDVYKRQTYHRARPNQPRLRRREDDYEPGRRGTDGRGARHRRCLLYTSPSPRDS